MVLVSLTFYPYISAIQDKSRAVMKPNLPLCELLIVFVGFRTLNPNQRCEYVFSTYGFRELNPTYTEFDSQFRHHDLTDVLGLQLEMERGFL